jgi:hypothetical protein
MEKNTILCLLLPRRYLDNSGVMNSSTEAVWHLIQATKTSKLNAYLREVVFMSSTSSLAENIPVFEIKCRHDVRASIPVATTDPRRGSFPAIDASSSCLKMFLPAWKHSSRDFPSKLDDIIANEDILPYVLYRMLTPGRAMCNVARGIVSRLDSRVAHVFCIAVMESLVKDVFGVLISYLPEEVSFLTVRRVCRYWHDMVEHFLYERSYKVS